MIILEKFLLFLPKNSEALLMSTHNIRFYGELEKIIPQLSSGMPPGMFDTSNGSKIG